MRSKGETFRLETNSERPWRGLKKDKLGAVIFGCKRHTIVECLKDGLFGLPGPHYAYVKNVTAGLTLYLFNYTDRKLHGIFEAVSCGKMNINPRAWITSEGTELTPYPAQVYIRERRKCRPLLEEQIKPIIAKNYFEEKHFWFELDKEQNRGLMKLFLSSPIPEKLPRLEKWPHPPDTTYSNMFDILSSSSQDDIADEENNHDTEEFSDMGEMRPNEDMHSSASENNADSSAQETKWADLFKPSISLLKNGKVHETNSASLNLPVSDMERKITSSSEQMGKLPREVCQDAVNTMSDSCVVDCSEVISFAVDDCEEVYENKMACTQYYDQDSDMLDVPFSEDKTSLDGEGELMLSVMDYVLAEEPGEVCIDTKEKVRSVLASLGSYERDHDQPNLPNRASQKNNNPLPGGVITDVSSSNFQYAIIKAYIVRLMQEVEGLKVSQLNQSLKIKHLEHELVLSKLEIDQLRRSYHKLEHKASCAPDNCRTEGCSISYSSSEESVFIVGGFDGFSWLPDLSLYSPNQDHVIPFCSMSSTRTYAAVAKLNTELYIFGGTLDGVWCDSVESYNPISNQWVQRPSLKMKKGSPAGASMHDKIFAIGGGNGAECFSEVEVFDPNFGSWIYTQSMLQKRFAPAAAAMNGAVYVAGGYDGKDYLRSVERFDPRQPAWTSIGCMNERRGCHSLVAFKEKLYAIGGYNGKEMVSTVEVFDPRFGSWMAGEPMTVSRGYFGSFVLGGKMYVIGGVQDNDVLDLMECYDESSSGWQVIGATAIGKRSFCSALVL